MKIKPKTTVINKPKIALLLSPEIKAWWAQVTVAEHLINYKS